MLNCLITLYSTNPSAFAVFCCVQWLHCFVHILQSRFFFRGGGGGGISPLEHYHFALS